MSDVTPIDHGARPSTCELVASSYYLYMTTAQQALVDARISLNLIKVRQESSSRIKAAAPVKGDK